MDCGRIVSFVMVVSAYVLVGCGSGGPNPEVNAAAPEENGEKPNANPATPEAVYKQAMAAAERDGLGGYAKFLTHDSQDRMCEMAIFGTRFQLAQLDPDRADEKLVIDQAKKLLEKYADVLKEVGPERKKSLEKLKDNARRLEFMKEISIVMKDVGGSNEPAESERDPGELTDVIIDGDTAVGTVKTFQPATAAEPAAEAIQKVKFQKIDGNWKIDLDF